MYKGVTVTLCWLLATMCTTAYADERSVLTHLYQHLYTTIAESKPQITEGHQHLVLLSSGKYLHYEDFCSNPRRRAYNVPKVVMQNMFDIVDIIPNAQYLVDDSRVHRPLTDTYYDILDFLKEALGDENLHRLEHSSNYLRHKIPDPEALENNGTVERIGLYYHYKHQFTAAKNIVHSEVEWRRKIMPPEEFSYWYDYNKQALDHIIEEARYKLEVVGERKEMEQWISRTKMRREYRDLLHARVLLLAYQHSSFRDPLGEMMYPVRFIPEDWTKYLYNRVEESVDMLAAQLNELRNTKKRIEEGRKAAKKHLASSNFVGRVQQAREEIESYEENMEQLTQIFAQRRIECIASRRRKEKVVCTEYHKVHQEMKALKQQYVRSLTFYHLLKDQLARYQSSVLTELNKFKKALKEKRKQVQKKKVDTARRLKSKPNPFKHMPEYNKTEGLNFTFNQSTTVLYPALEESILPPSLPHMWHIDTDVRLDIKRIAEQFAQETEYFNSLADSISVTATLHTVNIERRWLNASLFEVLREIDLDNKVLTSPGPMLSPEALRSELSSHSYLLPLYPSALLLATDVRLTFPHLPDPSALFSLAYQPRVSGGLGPFSFGPMFEGERKVKFRVEKTEGGAVISLPGTQLIGYICDIVPRFPSYTQL